MGCFNEIYVHCPNCNEGGAFFQTKSGTCEMKTFDINDVPPSELQGIIGDHENCKNCDEIITVGSFTEPRINASHLVY